MDAIKEKQKNNSTLYLLLSLTLLIATRLLPLLKGPLSTFGYDYGFYFYAAKQAASFRFYDLSAALWGGFNNPLFYIFNLLRLPPEFSLTLSYLAFTVLLGFSLYYLLSNFDRKAALFALLLYALSIIQMESYLMFLYKNAFTLPFMFLGFRYLMMQKWAPFIISTALIILTHRTTAIIYLLTIGLYFLWLLIKSKSYKLIFGGFIVGCLAVIVFWPQLKPDIYNLISHNNFYVRTGLFLPFDNPLKIVWPYLLLAVPGMVIYIWRKQNSLLIYFTALCLVWLIFQLPFYRRLWIYFDLSLIIFAAYFLSSLLSWPFGPELMVEGRGEGGTRSNLTRYFSAAMIIIFLFLSYRFTTFTLAKQPLILPSQIQEIKDFNNKNFPSPSMGRAGEGGGFILAVSANDAPWLLAYADNFRLGAPGLLEDPHTYEQWLDFWQGKNQRQFISEYPRPLYFYQRAYRLSLGEVARCLKPLAPNFSELDYECLEKTSR